ncbi:class I SAM-dependent methyltransferase [Aquimarina agarivorans]|uniref:class I SAM-dependent methyltransferase n=1 Tax=Aquimarina agarivorans TaxID=980584 RepID=UPI000B9B722E
MKYKNRSTFICSEVDEFSLNKLGTYDLVIASGVLHHLNDDELKNLLRTAVKALKVDGSL